jgi:Cu-Zn family superoxide dismutase
MFTWLAAAAALAAAVSFAAVGAAMPQAAAVTARATLQDDQGRTIGTADLRDTPHGVVLHIHLAAAPPGVHAFHLHQTGRCEAPAFTSAGGHFNPTGAAHGFLNANGPHAGDLPNIHVPDNGTLELEIHAAGATLAAGANSLFDADGSSIVMHAGPDDYAKGPAGTAGTRVVCGVVTQ